MKQLLNYLFPPKSPEQLLTESIQQQCRDFKVRRIRIQSTRYPDGTIIQYNQ